MGKVWKHASLVKSRADNEGDINIASIKRFESPIMLDGRPAIAYVTAKDSVEHGHRIYSLELTEIKTARGLGNTPRGAEKAYHIPSVIHHRPTMPRQHLGVALRLG